MRERPLRVVLATRVFSPEGNAAAFRLRALVRALIARSATVTAITTIPAPAFRRERDDSGARTSRWPVLRDPGGNVRGYLPYLSFDLPLAARLLCRAYDVIVAEPPPTTGLVVAVVARVRRVPFVYYAADVVSDGAAAIGSPRLVVSLVRMVERAVLRRAAAVLSVAPEVSRRVVALGARPDAVHTVGHGIDTEIFRADVTPHDPGYRYFVYAGTMSEVHSPQVFVRAFARISQMQPDVRLVFFGQGVYEKDIRELGRRLVPGRVVMGGMLTPEVTAGWLRGAVGALVSLTPGIGYDFAHPTKAYAAAACGTPILFSGPDDFGSIVARSGLGIAVGHDEVAVADAMLRLLDDHESGASTAAREQRARWADENASLRRVGAEAAEAVIAAARGSQHHAVRLTGVGGTGEEPT